MYVGTSRLGTTIICKIGCSSSVNTLDFLPVLNHFPNNSIKIKSSARNSHAYELEVERRNALELIRCDCYGLRIG